MKTTSASRFVTIGGLCHSRNRARCIERQHQEDSRNIKKRGFFTLKRACYGNLWNAKKRRKKLRSCLTGLSVPAAEALVSQLEHESQSAKFQCLPRSSSGVSEISGLEFCKSKPRPFSVSGYVTIGRFVSIRFEQDAKTLCNIRKIPEIKMKASIYIDRKNFYGIK